MTEYRDWELSKFAPVHMTKTGFVVAFPHYSCHPDRMPGTPEGEAWRREARKGYTSENDWRREQEIDFRAHVGKPIFPDFDQKIHGRELMPDPNLPLIRGWDPSFRHSVCIWLQIKEFDKGLPQVRWLREQTSLEADIGKLGDAVLKTEEALYLTFRGKIWDQIDVAGKQRTVNSKYTAIDILGSKGINAQWRYSGPEERILMFNYLLNNRTPEGEPCFLIDPRYNPRSLTAFGGLYRRKEKGTKIDENEATHYIDAGGYGAWNNLYFKFKRREVQEEKPKRPNLLEVYGIEGRPSQQKDWRAY